MEDLLNKKYSVELEVLTPLHVGAGSEKDWMKGADYIEDNGKIYVLNQKKLLKNISVDELANFLVEKDDRGLKNKISGSPETVSDLVFNSPASTDNDIKVFIKNGLTNKPIVPGSSVKGAICSVLFTYLRNNQTNPEAVFGSTKDGENFMRFFKVSDADFDETALVNTKIFNLYGSTPNFKGGWKHSGKKTTDEFQTTGFNTIYEVLLPGKRGMLTLALSDKAFDNFYKNGQPQKKSEIVHKEPSQKLFAIINQHTKAYIDKEIAFFKKYTNNETDKIIHTLEMVKNQIPADNSSCVFKKAAGSGFHSITGDWQFDDYSVDKVEDKKNRQGRVTGHIAKFRGNKTAKSRKIAVDGENFYLMGFVKLTLLSDEIKAKKEAERQARIEEEKQKEAERKAKEKAEQERIEAEKRARAEAARKAAEEQIAKEKKDREERQRLLAQRAEEEKQRQIANVKQREKVKKQGLAVLKEQTDFYKGIKLIKEYKKQVGGSIKPDQLEHIAEFVTNLYNPDDNKWRSFNKAYWKNIKQLVNKDIARQWFDELTNKK